MLIGGDFIPAISNDNDNRNGLRKQSYDARNAEACIRIQKLGYLLFVSDYSISFKAFSTLQQEFQVVLITVSAYKLIVLFTDFK